MYLFQGVTVRLKSCFIFLFLIVIIFINNIKMDLREIGWDGMDWIDLAQDRDQRRALVNAVMNLWVP
jgi:hypothetical protein